MVNEVGLVAEDAPQILPLPAVVAPPLGVHRLLKPPKSLEVCKGRAVEAVVEDA